MARVFVSACVFSFSMICLPLSRIHTRRIRYLRALCSKIILFFFAKGNDIDAQGCNCSLTARRKFFQISFLCTPSCRSPPRRGVARLNSARHRPPYARTLFRCRPAKNSAPEKASVAAMQNPFNALCGAAGSSLFLRGKIMLRQVPDTAQRGFPPFPRNFLYRPQRRWISKTDR